MSIHWNYWKNSFKSVVPTVAGTAPWGRWSRSGRLGGDRRPS